MRKILTFCHLFSIIELSIWLLPETHSKPFLLEVYMSFLKINVCASVQVALDTFFTLRVNTANAVYAPVDSENGVPAFRFLDEPENREVLHDISCVLLGGDYSDIRAYDINEGLDSSYRRVTIKVKDHHRGRMTVVDITVTGRGGWWKFYRATIKTVSQGFGFKTQVKTWDVGTTYPASENAVPHLPAHLRNVGFIYASES